MKEVAPPGWGHTKAEKEKTKPNKPKSKIGGSAHEFDKDLKSGKFKGLPGDKTMKDKRASMFKLMWAMKNKGDKPHYKPGEKGVKKSQYKEERMMSTRYTKSMADSWREAMTWKQAQDKDKKDQNKDPVGKKHEEETYSQRISKDVNLGNSSGVGGQTVFVPIEDGVTQQEEKDLDVYDVGDVKQKKGAVAASGSGTIAKAKKAKASDVNKSLEQQMADAMKEGSRAEAERKARNYKAKKDVASKMGKIRWRQNKGAVEEVEMDEKNISITGKDKNRKVRRYGSNQPRNISIPPKKKTEEVEIDEKKLSYKERQNLSKGDFALPGKGGGPEGKQGGSYPIPDESHARNALARVSQHGSEAEKAQVKAAVRRKYPNIKIGEDVEESTWSKNFKKQTAKRLGDIRRRKQAQQHSPGQRVPPKQEGYYKRQATDAAETERLAKRRDRADSDRLAKQQADREKKYQAAKKAAKEQYMDSYQEESSFQYDPLKSSFLNEAEWKVKLKGLPAFYVPGKSAGAVKQMLRKQLKRPQDDIESIDRAMGSDKKKDFRDRAAGRG